MSLEQKIKKAVDEYKQKAGKGQVHHIDVSLPGHDGRFWIIDAALLDAAPEGSGLRLAIYFSANRQSNRGKRVVQSIEVLDLFEGYTEAGDSRYLAYYKLTDNNSSSIAREVQAKAVALFPTLDTEAVAVSFDIREH
jgi:hypothetical protein